MNISIIGTGYVGLVSGTCFAEMGNQVICVDNSPEKLKKLKNAEVTIYEPGLDTIFQRNIEKNRISFTGNLKDAVLNTDIIFLCLPTPQGEDGSADLKYVTGVAKEIGKILKDSRTAEYKIIVNKSTVPVGTAQIVETEIKANGFENFGLIAKKHLL
jgi:UDPglucose 6-dehydrogenase